MTIALTRTTLTDHPIVCRHVGLPSSPETRPGSMNVSRPPPVLHFPPLILFSRFILLAPHCKGRFHRLSKTHKPKFINNLLVWFTFSVSADWYTDTTMAFAVTSSSAVHSSSLSSSFEQTKGTLFLFNSYSFSLSCFILICICINQSMIICSFLAVAQLGAFQPFDRPHLPSSTVNFSRRRCVVKPLNAEPKRNDSIVPSAATLFAPGT